MARLVVQYPGQARVLVDNEYRGDTNHVIVLEPGEYKVKLDGMTTEPEIQTLSVIADSDPEEVVQIGFRLAKRSIDRMSPLYCRYNGFLLGQFLVLAFSEYGRQEYHERRFRMLEFLQEVEVDVTLPEEPSDLGSESHVKLLGEVVRKMRRQSQELTDFVLLGALLVHHGLEADTDRQTARDSLEQIQLIQKDYLLPPIDMDRLVVKGGSRNPNDALSPSLAYLAELIDQLAVEQDTAFVIMPFNAPYASYFAKFYRPSLEAAGYRSFRAWGSLSSEDYCDLLLKLIEKSGIVWADVSELSYNVLYEIGAAHALDKLSMLVVREDLAAEVPANIGHDAVIKYSPDTDGWPDETVSRMTVTLFALKLAAEADNRPRVSPENLEAALETVGQQLKTTLIPPEAREAARIGQQMLDEGDDSWAEEKFDEAIQLGFDDAFTLIGRGTARFALGKYLEADADLTSALEYYGDTPTEREQKSRATFFRGLTREHKENYGEALEDYTAAIQLGYPGTDVYQRRSFVNIQLGELRAARGDVDNLRELAPESSDTLECEGDLLLAEESYPEAIARYDEVLALQKRPAADSPPNPSVRFSRSLALLLTGQIEKAVDGYSGGIEAATPDQIEWARQELVRRAGERPGMAECRAILES